MRADEGRLGLAGVFSAALLLGIIAAHPAAAQSSAQANAIRQSCRADYQAYCASVPTGGSAALECLQQNAARLSPSCQQAVGAVGGTHPSPSPQQSPAHGATPPPPAPLSPRERAAMMRQACGADYRTWCRGVRPGGGQALECLESHGQSLSPGCQRALMTFRQSR
jgi:hypothetical protein